jgi:hypothetical protein
LGEEICLSPSQKLIINHLKIIVMKTNKKINTDMPSDHELRTMFQGNCSEEEMDKAVSDAKRAFLFIKSQKEFRK